MVLIKLTSVDSHKLWVNPEYISSLCDGEFGGTDMFIAHDDHPTHVRETPEDIFTLIKSGYGEV